MSYYRRENQRVNRTVTRPVSLRLSGRPLDIRAPRTAPDGSRETDVCLSTKADKLQASGPSSSVISAPTGGRKYDEGFGRYQEFHS